MLLKPVIVFIPLVKVSDKTTTGCHSGNTAGLLSVADNGRSVTATGSDAAIGSHGMLISPRVGYLNWH